MGTINTTIRMDVDLKNKLQELVSNLGMDMTTFFTIAAKQAVREQRIPFEITMETPNKRTLQAMEEVVHKKNVSKTVSTVDELMEELDAED